MFYRIQNIGSHHFCVAVRLYIGSFFSAHKCIMENNRKNECEKNILTPNADGKCATFIFDEFIFIVAVAMKKKWNHPE